MNRIYIPPRLYTRLKSIYANRITLLYGDHGCGKSTMLREFILRSRPENISCRFITKEESADGTFARYCRIVLGKSLRIPVTEKDYLALRSVFSEAKPKKPLLIVLDTEGAADMLLGNLYCARLMAECANVSHVLTCSGTAFRREVLLEHLGINHISRSELTLTEEETAEYMSQCGCGTADAKLIHSRTNGMILGIRLCCMMISNGEEITDYGLDALIKQAVLSRLPESCRLAALCASVFTTLDETACNCLKQEEALTEYYGSDALTPEAMRSSIESINRLLPLIDHNRKTGVYSALYITKKACISDFNRLPQSVREALHRCIGRDNHRYGRNFIAYCHHCYGADFDLATALPRQDIVTFEKVLKSKKALYYIATKAPLDNKAMLPGILRIMAMLMLTDYREMISHRYTEVMEYIASAPQYDETERRSMLCYAHSLRMYEDFYRIDRMGIHIKRAYDLYSGEPKRIPAYYSWTLFTPSVFTLVHRYSVTVANETEQFCRYQKMYREMMTGADHLDGIYLSEAYYYTGDFQRSLAAACDISRRCKGEELLPTKLIALYVAAKCALMIGSYEQYTALSQELADIRRKNYSPEINDLTTLISASLCCMKQGDPADIWAVYSAKDEVIQYNRYAATYCYLTQCFALLWQREYDALLERCELYMSTAAQMHNETAMLMIETSVAAAYFQKGNADKGTRIMKEVLDTLMPTELIMPAVEICIHYPIVFEEALKHLGSEYTDILNRIIDAAVPLRRNIETLRCYELTLLNSDNNRRTLPADTEPSAADSRLADHLGISQKALKYALLAAKGCSNAEIASLTGTSIDSVKSSLKRTYTKLGIHSRSQLKRLIQ